MVPKFSSHRTGRHIHVSSAIKQSYFTSCWGFVLLCTLTGASTFSTFPTTEVIDLWASWHNSSTVTWSSSSLASISNRRSDCYFCSWWCNNLVITTGFVPCFLNVAVNQCHTTGIFFHSLGCNDTTGTLDWSAIVPPKCFTLVLLSSQFKLPMSLSKFSKKDLQAEL